MHFYEIFSFRAAFASQDDEIKIFPISDNSGYYITMTNSTTLTANLCKALYVNMPTIQCQEITNIGNFIYSTLMLSDTQLFTIGSDTINLYIWNIIYTIHQYNM